MRISLHSGPVYRFTDPLIQKINFSGAHVNRAARIEPATPPGQVYASEHFASLIVASNVAEITCDYVGTLPLAKGYGTFPMYHVRRSHEPE
jgi:class 3 adenylate cyclase